MEEMLPKIDATPIGSINGKWSILFRAMLAVGAVLLPMLIVLNVWFVQSIYDLRATQAEVATRFDSFIAVGPRYTPEMDRANMLQMRLDMIAAHSAMLEQIKMDYPPEWLRDRVEQNELKINELEKKTGIGQD